MAFRDLITRTGSDGSDPGQRIAQAGYSWTAYGEIVAFGCQTPQAVVDVWMNSPAHREVIITSVFRDFGAGLVFTSRGLLLDGRLWTPALV